MTDSFNLDRRTFLRGTGAALALPFMESLSFGREAAELPRRMAFVYFPFGVALPKDSSPGAEWNWFPKAGKLPKCAGVISALD